MPSKPRTAVGDDIPPGSGVIEVHVRELGQLFNSMDPSPFIERDLDVDAEEFIVSWAGEFPDDVPLALLVHLDNTTAIPHQARLLGGAVRSYFHHRAELTQRRLRQLFRRGRRSLAIGLTVLTGAILLGRWLEYLFRDQAFGELIRQSLIIGGWVAMWRPMEIFLYDWWPIRRERQVFDRLGASAVRVVCADDAVPDHSPTGAAATSAPTAR
jgi:hypothetical protein